MHLNSPPPSETSLRAEFEDWVAEGPRCLSEALLKGGDDRRASGPKARVLEPIRMADPAWLPEYGTAPREEAEPRCYQWVHIPSEFAGQPDIVAVIFTRHSDLLRWRQSDERRDWIRRGERFVTDRSKFVASQQPGGGGSSVLEQALEVQLQRDDGSLGGWLPHTPAKEGAAPPPPPPPSWKVAATVLVAMYPMQECNRLLFVPALSDLLLWEALGPACQLWAVCAWTCGLTTVALLPIARRFTESIGFIGGARGCPDARQLASRSVPLLLLVYAATVGVGAALVVALDRSDSDARPPVRKARVAASADAVDAS
jgi:antibiotic biosynthesis monooxygenase (ABM) superfamily enzyme